MFKFLIIFILFELCHVFCDCCQQNFTAGRSRNEIRNCSNTILPLNSTTANALKQLYLKENELGPNLSLNSFSNLRQLEYLELHENKFNYFENEGQEILPNLIELRIKESKLNLRLSDLPKNNKLKVLIVESSSLYSCDFKYFPKTLTRVIIVNTQVNIKWSSNTNCLCDEINSTLRMHLNMLHMKNCSLEDISLGQFKDTLTFLDLSQNKLKSFEGLQGLENLRFLDLSHNLITLIVEKDFSEMCEIGKLTLSYNLIESIPADCFRSNMRLREVDISHNRLTQLHLKSNYITKLTIDGSLVRCGIPRKTSQQREDIVILSPARNFDLILCNEKEKPKDFLPDYILYASALPITIILTFCGVIVVYQRIENRILHIKASKSNDINIYDEPEMVADSINVSTTDDELEESEGSEGSLDKPEGGIEFSIYSVVDKTKPTQTINDENE